MPGKRSAKPLRLAALEHCEKLFVVRVYTTFDAARAKAKKKSSKTGSQAPRTLEEEEAALEEFIDSAGQTDVPIEARCIRGNTGYAVLDFVQSVEACCWSCRSLLRPPSADGSQGTWRG